MSVQSSDGSPQIPFDWDQMFKGDLENVVAATTQEARAAVQPVKTKEAGEIEKAKKVVDVEATDQGIVLTGRDGKKHRIEILRLGASGTSGLTQQEQTMLNQKDHLKVIAQYVENIFIRQHATSDVVQRFLQDTQSVQQTLVTSEGLRRGDTVQAKDKYTEESGAATEFAKLTAYINAVLASNAAPVEEGSSALLDVVHHMVVPTDSATLLTAESREQGLTTIGAPQTNSLSSVVPGLINPNVLAAREEIKPLLMVRFENALASNLGDQEFIDAFKDLPPQVQFSYLPKLNSVQFGAIKDVVIKLLKDNCTKPMMLQEYIRGLTGTFIKDKLYAEIAKQENHVFVLDANVRSGFGQAMTQRQIVEFFEGVTGQVNIRKYGSTLFISPEQIQEARSALATVTSQASALRATDLMTQYATGVTEQLKTIVTDDLRARLQPSLGSGWGKVWMESYHNKYLREVVERTATPQAPLDVWKDGMTALALMQIGFVDNKKPSGKMSAKDLASYNALKGSLDELAELLKLTLILKSQWDQLQQDKGLKKAWGGRSPVA